MHTVKTSAAAPGSTSLLRSVRHGVHGRCQRLAIPASGTEDAPLLYVHLAAVLCLQTHHSPPVSLIYVKPLHIAQPALSCLHKDARGLLQQNSMHARLRSCYPLLPYYPAVRKSDTL